MKIAILSDIHDHLGTLIPALAWIEKQKIDTLICCGDLCAPFIMARLGQDFSGEVHLVFGNNDADLFRITHIAGTFGKRVHLHGELGEVELGGLRVGINHFHNIAQPLAASGMYDLVCFGHNHQYEWQQVAHANGSTHLLNPGTLMGYKFASGTPVSIPATFCLFNTESLSPEFYEVAKNGEIRPLANPT